jgi:hypothetical protein
MNAFDVAAWSADWAWSLPLIAVNVVVHVLGLGMMTAQVDRVLRGLQDRRRYTLIFATVMSIAVTFATCLHGAEAIAWAAAYRFLGTVPDGRTAVLYSLNAMTSYGNTAISLPAHWRLMGALEALNGMLLFGLTTAFLFAMIQRVRPIGGAGNPPD